MKLRVWHIPQVPGKPFYIYTNDIREAKKFLDVLAVYDVFQFENKIKPDFCNASGIEMYDEELKKWSDWKIETEEEFFNNLDDYFEGDKELFNFAKMLFSQSKFYGCE